MPRIIRRIKWYAAAACVTAAAAVPSGVALAQSDSGPVLHSSTGSGQAKSTDYVQVLPNGHTRPGDGRPPPGSTSYGQQGFGLGKAVVSRRYSTSGR